MSIRPVDFGGMIQRADDVGTMKHHQDQKAVNDQMNIQTQVVRETDKKTHQVQPGDKERMKEHAYDAKEGGNGGAYSRNNHGGSCKCSDKKKRYHRFWLYCKDLCTRRSPELHPDNQSKEY